MRAEEQGNPVDESKSEENEEGRQGLEYFNTVDQLRIKEHADVDKVLSRSESERRYSVKDGSGQTVYNAIEDLNCSAGSSGGNCQGFAMRILDGRDAEVMRIFRPLVSGADRLQNRSFQSCMGKCRYYRTKNTFRVVIDSINQLPCTLQRLEVFAPPDQLIGKVEQEQSLLVPKFQIMDSEGKRVARIKGPISTLSIFGSVKFQAKSEGGKAIGAIKKEWSGLFKEVLTDADHYGLTFSPELDVNVKALVFAAAFLIDFMFFSKRAI
ncbi:unnamed protein product [Darwinula stevensoni]|uniref:Phospholipid scramblase n=1 Tax=Darwinula stevensoni TaxID=69355 RepID=A0A7R9FR68_9CRUS|nr:unnamed protein product [Darwinula stevensoni]CAG0901092.1 unnamed protein product [Darwinula stevensoni]